MDRLPKGAEEILEKYGIEWVIKLSEGERMIELIITFCLGAIVSSVMTYYARIGSFMDIKQYDAFKKLYDKEKK